MLDEFTTILKNNQSLSFEEMTTAMNEILEGKYKDETIANFLQNFSTLFIILQRFAFFAKYCKGLQLLQNFALFPNFSSACNF